MAKKVKIAKPKVRELRTILSAIISAQVATRIDALAKAMQWYDVAIEYTIAKKHIEAKVAQKLINTAIKTREQGIRLKDPEKKEGEWIKTINTYQLICAKLRPPNIEKFYSKYSEIKKKLDTEDENANRKFQNVTEMLSKLFPKKLFGLTFVVDPRSTKSQRYDPETKQVTFSKKGAKECWTYFRQDGILPFALRETISVAKYTATVHDGAGGYTIDKKIEVQKYKEIHEAIVEYLRSDDAPIRLIKIPTTKAVRQKVGTLAGEGKGTTKTGRPKRRVGDEPYARGSAMFTLWERLKGGYELPKKDLFKGIKGNPEERLKWVIKHGPEKGWAITVNEDKVKMTLKVAEVI